MYGTKNTVMRIQAHQGSAAEAAYYEQSTLPQGWAMPTAIAPGISPAPLEDLMFHGGKVVPQMEFQNVYLGLDSVWQNGDRANIDAAIKCAMQFKDLNNVMVQYFPGASMTCDVRDSIGLNSAAPASIDEPGVQALAKHLFDANLVKQTDLNSCIFNFILPRGMILNLGNSSSQHGLGGYHGSVHFRRKGKTITIYYSANVYSEGQNGIPVFDTPWKNVVGTLVHELNEFRTDPDVNDAIVKNNNHFLGWTSRSGREVGDQPIFAAHDLHQVFKEVSDSTGFIMPVQFMYSNVVHGAEGPIPAPHS